MTQIEQETLSNLAKNGFAYQKEFLKHDDETKLLPGLYNKLELLEIEN